VTRVGAVARISFDRFKREGITHNSPLEDQSVLVYRAAAYYAKLNGFVPYTHAGPHGPVKGVRGNMNLTWLISNLFPDADKNERSRFGSLIGQVLRKTDAAVCLHKGEHGVTNGVPPTWFVADHMPENIVVVALNISKGSAAVPMPNFSEASYLTPRERRLLPEEVGENQPPQEVTVTKQLPQAFLDAQAVKSAEHKTFVAEILGFMAKQTMPMSTLEVHALAAPEKSPTTVRDALNELVEQSMLYRRQETKDEALVRGGGNGAPKATRPWLYYKADPVPTRTVLPDGVKPVISAQIRADQRSAQLDQYGDKLIEVFSRNYGRGVNRPSTVGKLAEATDLTADQVKAGLARLVTLGIIYRDGHGRYSLTDRRRGVKGKDKVKHPTQAQEATVTKAPAVKPAKPIANPDHGRLVSLASELLAEALHLGETEMVDTEELDALRKMNANLLDENARLRDAVNGLRQAIANLS
jgi:hypothetical protein